MSRVRPTTSSLYQNETRAADRLGPAGARPATSLLLLLLAMLLAQRAVAATDTWTGAGGDSNLRTPANWSGVLVPNPGDILAFDGFARFTPNNNFAAGTMFGGLTFNATAAGPFTISGNLIDLNGNITDNTPSFTNTLNLNLALQSTPTIFVAPNASLTIGSIISGVGFGLNETGSGLLTLSGANTFTGPVTVGSGAMLAITADGNLGAAPGAPAPGSLVLDGGATLLTSGADFTINANRGIQLVGPSASMVSIDTGQTVTYDGVIADGGTGGGLTKLNFGNLTLGGQSTYTGATTIGNGLLTLDFTQASAPASNIISASSTLNLGTPSGANAGLGNTSNNKLLINGKANTTNTQTFNNTNVSLGPAIFQVTSGAGGSATLNLGNLTHTPGGVANFILPASGAITTTAANVNGILGSWATIGTGTAQNNVVQGTTFATVNGGGQIIAYNGYTDYAAAVAGDTGPLIAAGTKLQGNVSASTNLRVNMGGTGIAVPVDDINAGTTTDINTISMINTAAGGTIYVGTGNTLRFGQYGGVFRQDTGSNATLYIGGTSNATQTGNGTNGSQGLGTITAGGSAIPNNPGEIIFTIDSNSETTGTVVVEPTITDNGTGAVTVAKAGAGSMKLDGHNTFSGGLYLLQGRLQFAGSEIGGANPDGGGTGPIYIFPGAQLFPSGAAGTINNPIFLAGTGINSDNTGAIRMGTTTLAGTITLTGNGRIGGGGAANGIGSLNAIISGQITGNFGFDAGAAGNSGSGGNSLTLTNLGNNYTGNTTIVGRTGGTAGNAYLNLGASQTTTGNGVIPHGVGTGNVIVGFNGDTTSTETLNLNGFSTTINGLASGTGSITLSNTFVENDSATNATLTLGDNNQTATFGGIIRDVSPNFTGTGGGTVAITKIGTGTQTFAGANTYSGDTNVNAGAVSVTGSLSSTGNVNVNTSATSAGALFGTGSVGNVTLAAANGSNKAVINPGAVGAGSTGTLTAASVTVNTGSDLQFDLATPSTSDGLSVGGTLTFNGASTISPSGSGTAGTFVVVTAGTAISGTAPTLVNPTSTRSTFTFDATSWDPVSNPTSRQIVIDITGGAANLLWTGATDGTTWDVVTTKNWKNLGNSQSDFFFNGDNLTFDDSGTPNYSVSLGSTVLPGSILVNNSAGDYVISGGGSIGGSGTLTKNGSRALTLATNNTYSGGTVFNAGTLFINSTGAIGTGPLTLNAGTIDNTSGASVTLSANNAQTWNADINFAGTNSLNLGNGNVTLRGSRIVTVGANTLTVGGVIADGGSGFGLTKAGPGTLALNGASTYTGPVAINAGTIRVGDFGALGAGTGGVNIASGAALDVGGFGAANAANGFGARQFNIIGAGPDGNGVLVNSGTNAQQNAFQVVNLTGDGTVGGPGRFDIRGGTPTLTLNSFTLTKAGAGQFSIVGADVSDGNIVVNGGTLSIETGTNIADNGTGKTITFNAGTTGQFFQTTGTLTRPIIVNGAGVTLGSASNNNTATVGSAVTLNADVTISATGGTNSGTLELDGVIRESGGVRNVTKAGGNTALLNGANTYSGVNTINGGALSAGILVNGGLPSGIGQSSSDAANVVLNGGVLQYSGSSATSTDRLFTLGTAGGSGLDASGGGSDAVTFANTGPIAFTGSGTRTLVLTGTNSDLNTLAPAIADGPGGATAVSKTGTGTWALTGSNAYSGGTSIAGGGTLVVASDGVLGAPSGALRIADGALSATGTFSSARPLTVTDPTSTILVAAGKTLTLTGPVTSSASTASLNKGNGSDTGMLVLDQGAAGVSVANMSANSGGLSVSGTTPLTVSGTLAVNDGVTMKFLNGPARLTHQVTTLNIGTTSGLLDLGNHALLVDNGATSENTVRAYLASGYNADPNTGIGNWLGATGITSADAIAAHNGANPNFRISVGYVNGNYATDPLINGPLPGQENLPTTKILIRPALYGDLNLDGKVDDTDLAILSGLGMYDQPTDRFGWFGGDLNHDGKVDDVDLQILSGAGNYNGPSYGAAGGGGASHASATPATPTLTGHTDASGEIVLSAATSQGTAGDGVLDFVYDPATGHMTIKYDGDSHITAANPLQVIRFKSAGGHFIAANFDQTAFGAGVTANATTLNGTASGANSVPDNYDLGAILPPGLTVSDLTADLTLQWNVFGGGLTLKNGDVIVPEPAALGLIAIGVAGVMARRRRAR